MFPRGSNHDESMMRADHIILGLDLTKEAGGKQACLVCLDEFQGAPERFP